jgi:hypothetical protein
VSVGVDIPVLAWSTPWTILGGRVQFLLAGPVVEVGVHHANYLRGVYNPLVAGQLAWDLGNNWGFSYLLGAYLDVNSEVAWSSTSLNQRFALSYTGNQLNLTANVIWGTHFDHVTDRPQLSGCPAPSVFSGCNPDFLNVDLTASRNSATGSSEWWPLDLLISMTLSRDHSGRSCPVATGLPGWACRIRTSESVREPPNWICVTISPEVGASPAAETRRVRAAVYGFAAPANSAGDLSAAGRSSRTGAILHSTS